MRFSIPVFGMSCILLLGAILTGAEPDPATQLQQADRLFKDGNYNDAFKVYQKIAVNAESTDSAVVRSLDQIGAALRQLGRIDELDPIREAIIATHAQDWQVLQAAAMSYLRIQHDGFIVEGEFVRGNRRSGSKGAQYATVNDRDRVRALQLLRQAMPLVMRATAKQRAEFYLDFADVLLQNRGRGAVSWQLQELTDIDTLPEAVPGNPYGYGFRGRGGFGSGRSSTNGAPVDADGNPVYFSVPVSWEQAKNDGQRWRWLLEQAKTVHPPVTNRVRKIWAEFLHQNFGVQTIQGSIGPLLSRLAQEAEDGDEGEKNDEPELNERTAPFSLTTLQETETIAKLANGVKRFTLPDEYNFIKVYQQIAAEPETGFAERALMELANIFSNRQQYPRAAQYWREIIERFKDDKNKTKAARLSQIVDPWGTFEGESVKNSGDGAELSFRFRNGELLELEAFTINYQQLLADVKTFLKSNPQKWDGNETQLGNLGYRIVYENEKKYLGKRVAQWKLELEPRADHFDRRISVSTPLQKAGAYLVTAKMKGGNTSRIIVWLDDTAIIKKQLDGKNWYYVADAKTGKPIPNARLDFFGFNIDRPNAKRYVTKVSEFVDQTDADGQLSVGNRRMEPGFNWLTTASTPDGRFAYLGFQGVWYQNRNWEQYQQNKVYIVTDRPVYRPGQTVKFKVWVRRADYLSKDRAVFAGKEFAFEATNPRNEKLLESKFTADQFGGFDGEIELAEDATLGVYNLQLPWQNNVGGSNTFRVEEYKKPEFEVTVDAPSEPVKLGEKITATVKAKYYFGAPVVNGTVKYKVERTAHDARWYPSDRWDWLYGRGYGWFGQDYDWYPGFARWGCYAPSPWWWNNSNDPPELVLENEVPIGPDGTVEIEIDTAIAAAVHGDEDHKYTISAEVVDDSRRVITGSGSVLVARDPFQVHVWLDRGYYRVGDVITANMKAQTIDQKPIVGAGTLTLFAITYDEQGKPTETEVESWPLKTDATGLAQQKFKAARAGQYRLAYSVTDTQGNMRQGGSIFLVRGKGSTAVDFQFNDLELIPDKKTYQPGETVKLLINANQPDATVLLFVRPSNGVYLPPQTIRLNGKSTVVDIGVEAKDFPNFFVEAMTLNRANVYQKVQELLVPPEQRIINVEVEPSADRYLPGQEAEVTIKLTDIDGNPIVASTVMTVYDRALEYISGGGNVPEIRDFFWKFRRSHSPRFESSLQRYFSNLLKKNETSMQNLGVFGYLSADSDKDQNAGRFAGGGVGGGIGGGGGFGGVMRKGRTMSRSNLAMDAAEVMPMAAPAMAAEGMEMADFSAAPAAGELVEPTIRKEFADTAYWNARITPDENGIAKVKFPMPENLTDWSLKVWSLGNGTRVGQGAGSAVTAKDVLVRLQAPRFFVETDEVIISANVHNYLDAEKLAQVELVLGGNSLEALDDVTRTVTIAADGEVRIDWKVKAVAEGEAVITVKALTDADSDAMQMTFPVFVHGMLKTESYTGVLRSDDKAGRFVVNVPAERRPDETRLEIRYSPTLAGAMVDALPYLLDYPYGCTEQTLNRFLPAVITQQTLLRMGVDLEQLADKQTNLNAQEIGDAAERAEQWKRFKVNPVFDTAEMEEIVKTGLKKLTDMQLADGGWGWFSGPRERAYPHTTATVVRGLQIARQNGLLLPDGVLEAGVEWLKKYQTEQVRLLKRGDRENPERPYRKSANNTDALVYMILVDAGINQDAMQDYLYRDRTKLSVYSLAMFGLSLVELDAAERVNMILQNIEQYYVEDLENETAYLKLPAGYAWWYWHGNEIEANAYYLKLLAKVEPNGVRAPRLVKYLLNNRKHASYWSSTRDTALCIEALAEYLKASGEDRPDFKLEVVVDGRVRKTVTINQDNLFSFDGTAVLAGEELGTGEHTVEFRKTGTGPLYWNAYMTNFTLEDPITATGLELKIRRKVYRLVQREDANVNVAGDRGQVVNQQVLKYDRIELKTGDEVRSGDLLEIELGIDSKNDYEYIILEDFKAAGNEPVDVRSGYLPDANGAYVEFRDEKVAFFFRSIARGTSSMSYRLRAEVPGTFSALPAISYGMYAPELKANSDEFKLRIADRE